MFRTFFVFLLCFIYFSSGFLYFCLAFFGLFHMLFEICVFSVFWRGQALRYKWGGGAGGGQGLVTGVTAQVIKNHSPTNANKANEQTKKQSKQSKQRGELQIGVVPGAFICYFSKSLKICLAGALTPRQTQASKTLRNPNPLTPRARKQARTDQNPYPWKAEWPPWY